MARELELLVAGRCGAALCGSGACRRLAHFAGARTRDGGVVAGRSRHGGWRAVDGCARGGQSRGGTTSATTATATGPTATCRGVHEPHRCQHRAERAKRFRHVETFKRSRRPLFFPACAGRHGPLRPRRGASEYPKPCERTTSVAVNVFVIATGLNRTTSPQAGVDPPQGFTKMLRRFGLSTPGEPALLILERRSRARAAPSA